MAKPFYLELNTGEHCSMNDKVIPVYVLTGFLGSGKTTLLNRILEDAKCKDLKPAILLNEVGDVNVEGELVGSDIPMAEVLGGCICCTSRGDLGLELVQLAQEHRPDVIWIESTGVAQPLEIMDGITEASLYAKLELKNVITVVDGRHLLDRLRIGSGKTFKLMKEQISAANILVLNKVDLVREDDLVEIQESLTDWNPYARIILTTRSELDPDLLYAENERIAYMDPQNVEHANHKHCNHELCDHDHDHGHHRELAPHDHVNVVTYYFKGSVDSVNFEKFLKQLPDDIYRAKGIVTFVDTASLFLFQYAYKEIDFLRITPQKSVNNVAVFIGEGFSQSELIARLERLEDQDRE
jgi:G3E family GTPase